MEMALKSLVCEFTKEPSKELLARENTLALLAFDGWASDVQDPRFLNTGLVQAEGSDLQEVWTSSLPVNSGIEGRINWSRNEELLYCSMRVPEDVNSDLAELSELAYTELLTFILAQGYGHIVRAWNYLADINLGDGDDERYVQFCQGRHQAFSGLGISSGYPAACALGHHGGDLVIYLLCAREPCVHCENPQQLSAYLYPRQYGPKSPSFARAAYKNWHSSQQVHISGTASIRGHQTLHEGDLQGQLEVTCANIDNLLTHVAQTVSLPTTPRMNLLKAYVRAADDVAAVGEVVQQHFNDAEHVLYLLADICRRELAVEIDGLCEV